MTDLAQVALDFCRECTGWEDASESMWGQWSNRMIVAKRGRSVVQRLRYTDPNAVMAEVRIWASRNSLVPKIEVHPERMIVSIYTRTGEFFGSEYYPDLCQGLLVASVNASRKLKAV